MYRNRDGWLLLTCVKVIPWKQGTACITRIVKKRHEEPVTVYNIAVKDWVSYFVGQIRVYVHNGNGYEGGSKTNKLLTGGGYIENG